MTKITPEQAYNAAKLLFPKNDVIIKKNTPSIRGTGDIGTTICGYGDPKIIGCEIDWPKGVTEWPQPRKCLM